MKARFLAWFRAQKWLRNKYGLTLVVFVAYVLLLDVTNVKNWALQMNDNAGLRKEIVRYEELIKETEDKLQHLKSNNDSLEKYAREHFFMKRDNEVIYLIED